MKVHLTACTLALLLAVSALSQPLGKTVKPRSNPAVQNLNALHQDGKGAVWVATNNGLMKVESSGRSLVLKLDLDIRSFWSDDELLVVGSSKGDLVHLHSGTGREIARIKLCSSPITAICKADDTWMIAASGEGVAIGNDNQWTWINYSKGLPDNSAQAMVWSPESNKLFIGTDLGVVSMAMDGKSDKAQMDWQTSTVSQLPLVASLLLKGDALYTLTAMGKLYTQRLTGPDGVDTGSTPTELPVRDVLKIMPSPLGFYYLDKSGVCEFDLQNMVSKEVQMQADLRDFVVLYEGIVLSANQKGNLMSADLRFSQAVLLPEGSGSVTALSGSENYLAACTRGLLHLTTLPLTETWLTYPLPGDALVTDMKFAGNRLFLGTFNAGVLITALDGVQIGEIRALSGLPDDNVLALEWHNDTLWVSTLGGLSMSTDGVSAVEGAEGTNWNTYIYDIQSTKNGLLLATDGSGVMQLNGSKVQRFPAMEELSGQTVYQITEDARHNLWVSTRDEGLWMYSSILNKASKVNNAPNISLIGAIGGGSGASVMLISDETLYLIDSSSTHEFSGALGFEVLSAEYLNCFYLDQGRRLFFASGNGVYSYRQEPFGGMKIRPFLSEIMVDMQPVNPAETNFKHNENQLYFGFDAMWFQDYENLIFDYKLEGIDTDWNTTRNKGVGYPNLPAGTYALLIKAKTGDKGHGQSELYTHRFTVATPFYARWWFILLSAGLLSASLYFAMMFRLNAINKKRLAEKRQVEVELQNLRNQINPHFLFNSLNTLMGIIETSPKAAAEYLQRLSDFYRNMLQSHPGQVRSMEAEIAGFEEYMYLQRQRFGDAIGYELHIPTSWNHTLLPILTLQLLAENAIKHNEALRSCPLIVTLTVEGTHLVVRNEKRPKKVSEPGTGHGLKNIVERYALLFNAEVIVNKTDKFFEVMLPKIEP